MRGRGGHGLVHVFAVLSILSGAGAAEAGWQDHATAFDVKRLSGLEQSRSKGIDALASGPVSGDAAAMREVASAESSGVSASELAGSWRCRTLKFGGITSVAYSWFACKISDRGGHLYFQKTSGSQRIQGFLYPHDDGGFVLLGAWSVAGEPMHQYSGNRDSYGAEATPDDAIGLLTGIGSGHARIEFPNPVQESVFDIIELKR